MYGVFIHTGGDVFKGYTFDVIFTGTEQECQQWMKANPFKGDWISRI